MMKLLLVGAGGFVGSVLRYLVSGAAQALFRNSTFPLGTLAVNVTGCFAIGLISQLAESRGFLGGPSRTFLVIGVLGGYTTFSAYASESFNLLRAGEAPLAMVNVAAQALLGLCCVWLGRDAAYLLWR
ncbi:MAG TPA: fluoride efflux transporter CrcB [Candidatus Polarisedimenticolia bacterium]|nr:fluoride efflux transporter CrcB [Candidatus Polarisedimenticolia bacterium]